MRSRPWSRSSGREVVWLCWRWLRASWFRDFGRSRGERLVRRAERRSRLESGSCGARSSPNWSTKMKRRTHPQIPRMGHPQKRTFSDKTSSAKHRTSVYIDDFAGHEVGQVGGEEEDRAGNLFGGGRAAQRNRRGGHLLAGLGIENGIGHVGGDPAGGHGVHQDAVAGEFRREAFGEADDGAF